MADTIDVEIAYAERNRQFLRRLTLPAGATIADAIAASNLEEEFSIDVRSLSTGVWSKPASRDAVLSDGDRIELYRPLEVDPKDARRRRAASAKPPRD
jgi:putative ubiquitin-RnfH superfamily antitoxin RatB of RatAB toxin-antitoxin module